MGRHAVQGVPQGDGWMDLRAWAGYSTPQISLGKSPSLTENLASQRYVSALSGQK